MAYTPTVWVDDSMPDLDAPNLNKIEAALVAADGYASMAALRAATVAASTARLLGYYSAGDGGGGIFRWDSTDTTSTDNGGTIITPTSGLSGRWKRVYEGKLNLRWFGMHPSLTDNTAQLQAAVTWLATDTTRNPGNVTTGGAGLLPEGLYKCQFTAGTSGLSTITVGADNVLIEGEGRGSILTVRSPSAHVVRFFTFTQGVRGQGGGVRDILFEGNSQLEWCIYMTTWRNAAFENVSARDVFSGILDAESTHASDLGEDINVDHLDYISSSAVSSCFTQYGARFRASAAGTTWTDCSIQNSLFVNCWDSGVLLDGCARFNVENVRASCNTTSTNTIDGSSRTGILHAVQITNSITSSFTADTGFHTIENIYMESHSGSETFAANSAVWIDTPVGQSTGLNRFNRIRNVAISTTLGPSILNVSNTSATTGLTASNTFEGNRRAISNTHILIGIGAADTYLYLTPNFGQFFKILDQGTRTYINGTRNYAYGANYPSVIVSNSATPDAGLITRDTATGRVCWQDRNNTPILIGPRHGADMVSPYGAQRITSLATPAAPSISIGNTGSTTWTYYVVAIDKDGNKTPPSAAGTVTNGPASLAGSNQNTITWSPVDGAVTYDLLRGATNTSLALGLIGCFYQDSGASTSAYTASATSPAGTLTVDGNMTVGALSYRVDPPSAWPARTRAWLAENYPLILGDNQTAVPTAGRLEVVRLTLPVAASVTNVLTYAQAGGTALTAGQCFAVLYSAAGARVGVTADQATAWASSGLKTMALASGPFACAAGDYYVAFWFNGTTGPAFVRKSVSSGVNQMNAGTAAPNLLWASADTGLTTTSPSPMGAQTAQGTAWWVGLS